MKKPIRILGALFAFGAASLAVHAQPAFKLLVVDMAKLYDTHWETIDQNAKLQTDDQKANEIVLGLNTEGNTLVEEYKALNDQANNPALTVEAKSKAQADAQKKLEAINTKRQEVQTFVQNTQRSLQQRLQQFRGIMLEKIGKVAADVGKRKGATLVLDKAGPTLIGVSGVVYYDPSYEITDEVAKELAKDRPAGMPEGKANPGTPTVVPSAPSDVPRINVMPTSPAKK